MIPKLLFLSEVLTRVSAILDSVCGAAKTCPTQTAVNIKLKHVIFSLYINSLGNLKFKKNVYRYINSRPYLLSF